MKFAIALSIALLAVASAPAATVVSYDLTDVLNWSTIGGSGDTVLSDGDTVFTSTIGFDTSTAYMDDSSADYDGPAQYGGAYRQAVYTDAQTSTGTWFQLRTDLGLYGRRNGPAAEGTSGTIRIGTLFELDAASASYAIDSDSSFSIVYAGASVTSDSATLFVENGGLLYVADMGISPSSGTTQTFDNLDTLDFQQVTVDGSTLALTNVGSTVAGSTLTDITKAGFFVEIIVSTNPANPAPSIQAFSADLTAIPEPVSLSLMGLALAGVAARRRRSTR